MNGTSNGKTRTVVAISVMWVVAIPLIVLLFTRLAGWPLDLAILTLLPVVVIWGPGSYALAIAGNDRHQRGEGLGLSSRVLARSAVLGVLTAFLSAVAIWLYGSWKAGAYVGLAIAAVLGGLCAWGAIRIFRQVVGEIRHG